MPIPPKMSAFHLRLTAVRRADQGEFRNGVAASALARTAVTYFCQFVPLLI
jgi:hypothetical protein